jgi:hypothetical protein
MLATIGGFQPFIMSLLELGLVEIRGLLRIFEIL